MKTNFNLIFLTALLMISIVMTGQNNPDFTLASNGVTCLCPDANFGDTGTLTINGQQKTFTKRTRTQLDALIANDVDDPQVALTCTSGINDMSDMFNDQIVNASISTFNQNLHHWDVSNVNNMSRMFVDAENFNQPLNNWDVSNVTDMSFMFFDAKSFDQPLSNWDVSNVTSMRGLFGGSDFDLIFNQPINNWDVSNVIDMAGVFQNNIAFNQFIGNWDVSNVTDMGLMFFNAKSFDQPVNNWNVSNVTDMRSMFSKATTFNQDLGVWSFNQNVSLSNFLNNTNLSTNSYDLLLQSFNNQGLVDKELGAISLGYCDETTRNNLINNKNWTITGDVLGQCGDTFNPSTTPFVTTWTVQPGDLDIEIFTINAFDYDFTVDWGDGQIDQNVNSDVTHSYSSSGTYTVSVTGVFPYFKSCNVVSGNVTNCGNATKLTSVESWGDQQWRYMLGSFNGAQNFVLNTNQPPDLTFVTSLSEIFRGAENFNADINNWDVSNVTDMSLMFFDAISFDQPLNNWDVSNVTDMRSMFSGAESFNKGLNNWDVSNVSDMSFMLFHAISFDQSLNNWDVSNVTDMSGMFHSADSFNQPLNNWDVSSVTDMSAIFLGADFFNQPLNNWDVSNVTDMSSMFSAAEFI